MDGSWGCYLGLGPCPWVWQYQTGCPSWQLSSAVCEGFEGSSGRRPSAAGPRTWSPAFLQSSPLSPCLHMFLKLLGVCWDSLGVAGFLVSGKIGLGGIHAECINLISWFQWIWENASQSPISPQYLNMGDAAMIFCKNRPGTPDKTFDTKTEEKNFLWAPTKNYAWIDKEGTPFLCKHKDTAGNCKILHVLHESWWGKWVKNLLLTSFCRLSPFLWDSRWGSNVRGRLRYEVSYRAKLLQLNLGLQMHIFCTKPSKTNLLQLAKGLLQTNL